MKKLIICEKPSLAMNVAKALKVYKRKDGFIEGENTIVTFAFGHLFGLKDVSHYLGVEKIRWSEVKLPFIPNPFEFKLKNDDGVKKQYRIINELINREEVSEIVNCGDADREGELIINLIIKNIGTKKPVKRLWLPEQTEETIRKQMNNLEDNSKYKNLYNEGLARTYMDWLLGINVTMYMSVKTGTLLRAGRVLIPIVKYIYDKDMAIKNFVVENYFQPESAIEKDGISLKLRIKDKFSQSDESKANELCDFLNKHKAIVSNVESKNVTKNPSKLFSLSKLQSHLSKNFKMNFKSSLEIIQTLYEKGYITYPRTNTEFLAENEKEKVQKILNLLSEYQVEFKDTKRIFDDKKIESHSAITITTEFPDIEKDLENEKEKIVYKTIFNRFISNFLIEETILAQTDVEMKVANEVFNFKGSTVVQEGFYKYEPPKAVKEENSEDDGAEDEDTKLPVLSVGEELPVNFIPVKKKTTPPKKATESTLASYLKNPFKDEKKELSEDEEYKQMLKGVEIGTEATRTAIVENAKKIQYISQKGSVYSIETLGIQFIELLDKLNINLYSEKTVEFSKKLKEIFKNESTLDEAISLTIQELNDITNQNIEVEKINRESIKESLGNCPLCKSPVYEFKTKENNLFFPCSNRDCKFKLFENTKIFGTDVKLTATKVKNLISGKKAKFTLFSKKTNKNYEAYVVYDGMNGNFVNFKMAGFPNSKKV